MRIDLSALDAGNASQRRLDHVWLISAANLLLGKYNHLPMHIALPREHGIQLQLQRNAFYSALAQRQGETSCSELDENSAATLELCRKPWSQDDGPFLFDEAAGAELDGKTHLYTNTHQKAEPGYFRRYFHPAVAFPWLGDSVSRPSTGSAKTREDFVDEASSALIEVLDNFSKHAFNWLDRDFSADWLGPGIVHGARSGLVASVTKGGTGSRDRLYFLAFDNGFCIPRTMRWQHPRELEQETAEHITEQVLRERLIARGFEGHCGAGLWQLGELVKVDGGRITVITEDDQSQDRCAVRIDAQVTKHAGQPDLECEHSRLSVPWRGTTIRVMANIPRPPSLTAESPARTSSYRRSSRYAEAST